jgi:hypothetical protein
MRIAACNASGTMALSGWRLGEDAELPVTRSREGVAMLKLPESAPALCALCNAAAAAGLQKPRSPSELHITIGSARPERVRAALLACERWELAVARSPGDERGIRVNGFLEVTPIRVPHESPDESRKGSNRAKRVHVYAPSLPSQYAGSVASDGEFGQLGGH